MPYQGPESRDLRNLRWGEDLTIDERQTIVYVFIDHSQVPRFGGTR